MSQFQYWTTGSQIVYREVWRGKVWTARPVTVVQDASDLVALYLCSGTRWKMPVPLDGSTDRAKLFYCLLPTGNWQLVDTTWMWGDTLLLIHPGKAHAVHVMWGEENREFVGGIDRVDNSPKAGILWPNHTFLLTRGGGSKDDGQRTF